MLVLLEQWQDYVLAVAALGFTIALIPTIEAHYKPALLTAIGTIACLIAVIIAYSSLKLWFSVTTVSLNLLAWSMIAVQKYRQMNRARRKRRSKRR